MLPAKIRDESGENYTLRLVIAMLLPFAACGIQLLLWGTIKPFVWFLFFPTVFCSAWIGGMSGGLASAIISALLVWYVFIPPQFSWAVDNFNNIYSVAMFVAMGGLFGLVFSRLERAKRQLQDSNLKISALYEKTKEMDTLKTRFFATVSHELRTPLALILGPVSTWLNSDDLKEQTRSDLEIVERNARLLLRQVNDLLDVAKFEAGRMTMQYVQTDLAHQVRLIASHFTILAGERSIDFAVEADTAIPAQIDCVKFQRITLNLLSNAFKFTPDHGAIRMTLSQSGDLAILTVQDTGRGIPKDKHEFIFEAFRQIDGASNRQHGGTGLGLSIVKDFVLLHGGTVAVENVPEGGALFIVTLPVHAPSGMAVAPADVSAADAADISTQVIEELRTRIVPGLARVSAQTGGSTVLVVEDNCDMNSFICSTLQPHFRVLSAFNGNDGLKAALEHKPDLILSDIMMPGMSGDTMFAEIRTHQELKDIPVIMLTAKADDDLQVKMLSIGVHDFIRKPFLPDELLARVANSLAERREADNRLYAEEDRFTSLVKASPIGIFQTDCEGNCTYVNERWCDITGVSCDAALGDGWTATLHPDDRQLVFDAWNNAVKSNETFRLEYRFQSPHNEIRWVYGQAAATTDPSGEISGYIGTITEITDRKQAEITLKNVYELMRYIIEHSRSAIAVHDRDLNYIYVSQRYLQDYGIKDKNIIGKHHYDVLPDIPQKWRDVHRKALAGEVSSAEFDSYQREDGSLEWTRWECRPWYEADGAVGGIIIYTEVITERKRAEDELISNRALLNNIINSTSDAIYVKDLQGRYVLFNAAAEKAVGKSAAEVIGMDDNFIFAHSDAKKIMEGDRRVMEEGVVRTYEELVTEANGDNITYLSTKGPLFDVNGVTTGIFGIARDISERKHFEDALKNSIQRFQTILNASPVPNALNDDHGTITFINPAFSTTFGYSSEDIPTLKQWWECAYPDADYRASVIETWGRHIDIANKNGTAFEAMQVKIRCKDGTVKTVIADAASLDKSLHNEHLIVLFDISDRLELQLVETKLSTIFRTSPDMITVTEKATGRFIEVNDAFERVFGLTRSETIGKTSTELGVWGEDRCRQEVLDAYSDNHPLMNFKTLFRRKNGEVFPGLISVDSIVMNETECLVMSVRDITDHEDILRRLQGAKEDADSANRAKSQFLTNMSHEIRTPMNGIIAICQLLQMTDMNEEQREYTGLLASASKNLLKLITDILDLSRIEAGSVELEIHDFDLAVEMQDTIDVFTLLAKDKGLEFDFLIDPEVSLLLSGDVTRLRQIVTNLIGNAIKFSAKGSISLHISTDTEDEQRVTLRFQVRDSGIGIAQDNFDKIFDAFTQADSATSIKYGGTGLGLAIARHLVELQGGSIGVESIEGQGATFWFTVVLQKQTDVPGSYPAAPVIKAGSTRNSDIRILLVEDDEANQFAFERLLSKCSFQAFIAENGRVALTLLEEHDFDLVLMDCRMPVMDGYEATAAIRNQSSKVRNHAIPIVALTANALPEDRKKCLDAGMDDYISKPIDFPMLLDLINKWVNQM